MTLEEKEVFDRVRKIVVAQLGVAPDGVTMVTSFTKDLGADPVAVIELEFALGEEFGIEIPDVEAEKMTTVGDAVTYIKSVV